MDAVAGDLAQILPPTTQGDFRGAEAREARYAGPNRLMCLVLVLLLLRGEEMSPSAAEGAVGAAEHGLADVLVRTALAVKRLFGAVVDAGDAQGEEVERQGGDDELLAGIVAAIRAESPFVIAAPDLVVVVDHSDDAVAEPRVTALVQVQRVPEQVEILGRVRLALGHAPQLLLHIAETQCGVETRRLDRLKRPGARDLADEQEFLLAEPRRVFVDHARKVPRRPVAHVFDRVDPVAVDVGVGDPVFVALAEGAQGR